MKILVTEPEYFDVAASAVLRDVGELILKRVTRQELINLVTDVDAIIVRIDTKVDKEVLDAAKKLKLVASVTTGINHIDMDYAGKRGIKVINLVGAHTESTSQHTIALLLSLCRRIPWAYENLRSGKWERHRFFGTLLKDKTMGIVGLGKIGRTTASYGKALGMNIIAFDPYVKSSEYELVSINDLLKRSDVIVIHAMLTKETENLISKEQFEMMKETAFLINTARGQIVNEDDLLEALENKKISGAAVDVFSEEPLNQESKIIKYARENQNLLITPHLGATTLESMREASLEIANRVKEELSK